MKSLHTVVTAVLKSQDNWKIRLMSQWELIVGAMGQHICLEKIVDATLIVGVHDTKWMQQLHYLSHELIDLINRGLEGSYVTAIRLVLSRRLRISYSKPRRKTTSTADVRKITYARRTLTHKQLQALQHITDNELQNCLRDLMQMSV